jgi:gluconate 2-dehydrogenase gamma chain
MAGQGIERREALRVLALAAAASHYTGFRQWVFADPARDAQRANERTAGPYVPTFFSPVEYATVEALASLIIPSDETPGAREAGVSEFVDFMAASDPSIQPRFRRGLGWLDAWAVAQAGQPFRQLDATAQTALLDRLAYARHQRPGEEEGRAFFRLIRDYTVMGFYTSRTGLEELRYPGLRMYTEAPGCPHPDDPEHLRPERA